MLCLADTHIALWLIEDSKRLSKKARAMMQDAGNSWYLSYASVWEVALKHAKRPDAVPLEAKAFHDACTTSGLRDLPIQLDHLYRVALLPESDAHADPFDRILLAQAKSEDLLLVTHDKALAAYDDRHVLVV